MELDTFFVSVERLHDPSLVGKPVVVGGTRGGRGVVTAASYEVRAYDVRSGMPLAEASRLAPKEAIFVSSRHDSYGSYSEKVQQIVERYSAPTADVSPRALGVGSRRSAPPMEPGRG